LAACDGKAVIGLPGNPVSALVNGYLFVVPVLEAILGALPVPKATTFAKLTVNLPSQAGREDWWPVRLYPSHSERRREFEAEPIFGKSNLIFTLVAANGLLRINPDATGLSAGELVEVFII
jgi:molybdopterin molybdotransferase